MSPFKASLQSLTAAVVLFSATQAFSCTATIVHSMSPILAQSAAALESESDAELARAAMPGSLKLLEGVQRSAPDDDQVRVLLMRGWTGYALLFMEERDRAAARDFYRRARELGLERLRRDPDFAAALEQGGKSLDDALAALDDKRTELLFWTAASWGLLLNLSLDDPAELVNLERVKALMRRAAELRPDYYYGGPDLFLGAMEGARPKALGGNSEAAREHFEKALKAGGRRFLLTQVYYARFYALPTADEKLARSLLKEVLDADSKILPEAAAANARARRAALEMLRGMGDEPSPAEKPTEAPEKLFSE